MKLSLFSPKQSLNKAYLKEKVSRTDIELFKKNLTILSSKINEQESEEHHKYPVADFLKDTWYKDQFEINTKGRSDFVIHSGKTTKEPVGVIIEVKRPTNKSEMMSLAKPNAKAMHELILYYLQERIIHQNTAIKYLVATNIYEWFIIDEVWFDKHVYRNSKLRKQYEEDYKQGGHDTKFFYESIAKPFLETLEEPLPCTYFNFKDFDTIITNQDQKDDSKLIALYKILSPAHLLKQAFGNDSNSLDPRFYTELLHIIGLEEIKDGGKKLIKRKLKPDDASLLENTILKLEDKESLRNIPNLSQYGNSRPDQLFNVALELCITWVNRILFLKLLEAQLYNYHKGKKEYQFLDTGLIHDYDELNNLFFQVLAEKPSTRKENVKEKFSKIPYLNSSLFERTELERKTFDIGGLDNRLELSLAVSTVLKNEQGKRRIGKALTLSYFFDFLNAYDFTSEGSEEIQEENKNLINASVLGLIFEKINGYKDGSFFTPGFITMYMCRETIRRAVVQKFNEKHSIDCETFEDLKNFVGSRFKQKDVLEHNALINSLKICDPAVGSGHFLVSALNELIAIKAELNILADKDGSLLSGYEVKIENDELIITYNNNTEIFEYTLTGNSVDPKIQRVQKTLFHEKEALIENCLFGVDINPNSVKICRLRLWIELLKNAYYTEESKFLELETLPNIDINIKCGNSLISRFGLDSDLGAALKKSKWNIDSYRLAVHTYHNAHTKEQKREMEQLIDEIKGNFRSEISNNDPKVARKNKLGGELYNLVSQVQVFEPSAADKKERKKKQQKLEEEVNKLSTEIEEIKSNKIYENAFEWRFEFPEVLDNEGGFVGFDVVIGNPPYLSSKAFDKKLISYLLENYSTSQYQLDLYVSFMEKGIQILKQKSFITFITPNSWLKNMMFSGCRQFLLNSVSFKTIFPNMENVFSEASVDTLIFTAQKELNESSIDVFQFKKQEALFKHKIQQNRFEKNERFVFNVESSGDVNSIIEKIRVKSVQLQSVCEITRGVNPYDKYQGQSEDIIKSKAYHSDYKKDESFVPEIRGRHVSSYSYKWDSKHYISYGDWLAAPRESKFFTGPRIIMRQVLGSKLNCTVIRENLIIDQSIFIAKPLAHNEKYLNAMQGILASKLIAQYFKFTSNEFDALFPKIKIGEFRELPILKDLEKVKIALEDKVELLLNQKGTNQNIENNHLEKEIDQLVYQLYGLTEEEIRIVEGETV
ncbi:MAG: Eco57I restriction-modification methylase domain-containing protein [Opitutaceae bacterium]|nr:Eco57I restriction-modification methylase domain-containing protein [Cytophagales bacterium]